MKRIVLTLIMCLLGLLGTKAQVTTTITINKDGNSDEIKNTALFPVNSYSGAPYSVSQMIYVQSQFLDAAGGENVPVGEITDIAFVITDGNTVKDTRQWRVYIKPITNKSAFSSKTNWETMLDKDLYFDGDVELPESGDVNIKLDNNFKYTGGNIVVCVCDDGGAKGSAASFKYFAATEYRSLGRRNDMSKYDPATSLGTASNWGVVSPVIKFTFKAEVKFDLNVNVTDGTTPMQGVSVNVTGKDSDGAVQVDGSTAANGTCTFVDLNEPDGDCYTVTISKKGYKTVREEVCADDIEEGEVTLNVVMEKSLPGPTYLETDKTLYGENDYVTFFWDKVSSSDVKYYRLYQKVGGQWNAVVTVDATVSQYKTTQNYLYGEYEFCVVAVYDQGESEKGEASALVVVASEGSISGYVRNEGGWALTGATVIVEYVGQGSTMSYKTTTDSEGKFTIADVMTGEYKITASMPDYYDKIVTDITVDKGQTTDVGNIFLKAYPYWDCTVNAVVNYNDTPVYSDDYCEVTWSGNEAGSYTYYNIYRKNVETGEIELISHYTNITNQYYKDADWVNLNDGIYQYGVAPFTGNILDVLIEEFNHEGAWPEGWSVKASAGSDWVIANRDTHDFVGYAYDDPYGYDKSRYWVSAKALNGEHLLITPQVNVREALLSFYYATSGGSGNPCLEVRWSTSPTGPWTEKLWVNTVEEETWFSWREKDPALDISELPEKYVYLAFVNTVYSQYANQNGGSYNSAFIDGVKLQSREVTKTVWSKEVVKNTAVVFDNNNNTGDHNWFTATNWTGGIVPKDGDNVKIIAGAVIPSGNNVEVKNVEITDGASSVGSLTIDNGATFKSTGFFRTNNDPAKFVINDGAQVYQNKEGVQATFNMNIVKPGSWGEDHKGGWQFIASPFTDADVLQYVQPANGDYDLYKYDGSVDTLEWRNYKLHHDELICHFASDAEGWTGKNGWEYAPLRNGRDGNPGCMSISLIDQSANGYLISPRKLNIYPESRLRFYVKIHLNEGGSMDANSGINVVYSKQETPIAFETIEAVNKVFNATGWTMVEVDLGSIANTTDVDAEEAWIAIQCNMQGSDADAILVDDIEYAYVYTFNFEKQFNAQPFEKTFVQGRGYMASYESETTVSMTGTLYHENAFTYSGLTYSGANRWANFFLLGNPFPYDVKWSEFSPSGIVPGFAVVNSTSGAYQYDVDVESTIKSGDGFMILTNAANPSLKITATRGANNRNTDYINVVANGAAGSDNLIISLAGKENGGFLKLDNFNDDIAKVFVTNYDDMYGIAYYDEDVEEVDFCFNASDLGYYTISMIPNGDFTSLKLYDRVENIETDMIQNKEYKFFALSNDDANENRFVLRYAKKNVEAEGNFAYQSGNDLVVNAEGLIQIVDVMGRIVYSGETQGVNNRINVSGMENATYVIRNINNNEVRTQKIVIL